MEGQHFKGWQASVGGRLLLTDEMINPADYAVPVQDSTDYSYILELTAVWGNLPNEVYHSLSWNGEEVVSEQKFLVDYDVVNDGEYVTIGADGGEAYYLVSEDRTIDSLVVRGTVHLVLKDDTTLTVKSGTYVLGNLFIYGQSGGTGAFNSTGFWRAFFPHRN